MRNFKLKPGQTDYTSIRYAPVINCVLLYEGKILIMQRSNELDFYPGCWNGISGFLDDDMDFEDKVKEELREESGMKAENIISIKMGEIFHQEAKEHNKTWIVHPVVVNVTTDKVVKDWEAQDYKWVKLEEAFKFNLLPGFNKVLESIKNLISEFK